MDIIDKLKYEYSFYIHYIAHSNSNKINQEEKNLFKVMISNNVKYMLFASFSSWYIKNMIIKSNRRIVSFLLFVLLNTTAILISNNFNIRLLNCYNIFSKAPPDFWSLRGKDSVIRIILDDNYKIKNISNESEKNI